ncbi:MAG: hypothetical protein ACSLE8_02625 [Rhodococcus sp. (in: high G+C Gram-positive bacteria)]
MTRGRSTNEEFVATTGEQTAVDVVAQSIATEGIDSPALARRAELRMVDDIRLEIERSRWSELMNTERTLASWAGRGPTDYLSEPEVDARRPTNSATR